MTKYAVIPDNIKREHLLKAIRKIDNEGIPFRAHSSTYDLLYKGDKYPPKLVVSYANIFANNYELNRSDFRGGKNTQAFTLLENEGFMIVGKTYKKSNRKNKYRQRVKTNHRKQGIEVRSGSESYIVNLEHNKIQENYYNYLKVSYPDDDISMEEDFVDIKRENEKEITLYEVKSYEYVEDCIKEALGQILYYAYQLDTAKTLKLIVVGPSEPKEREYHFLKYIKTLLNIDFDYIKY